MTLLDFVAELTGQLPGLAPQLAERHINRAYQEILDARLWSFLVADGAVVCPAAVTSGTANITQYLATVTLDATASAALLAQTVGGAVPGLTNMQIRFGATSPAQGQVYNIIAADTTNPAAIVLTLDREVLEATNATSGIQVYRCYITPPIPDFKSWISFVDMANGFAFVDRSGRITHTSAEFDSRDPQRASQGLAYFLGSYVGNRISDPVTGAVVPNPNVDFGTPIYELWPHPTSGQTFYVRFRRTGEQLLQPTDTQQPGISDGLILQRALGWHTYQWAMANVAHYPTFKGVNFVQLIDAARSYYKDELLDAKRNDNETALQDVWVRGHGLRPGPRDFGYPIDSNFLQSHLVRF